MDSDLLTATARRLAPIAVLYDHRLQECGATPNGVFWRNREGQRLRFEVLLGVIDAKDEFGAISVNDLGCGYGALFEFMADQPMMRAGRYLGYDISEGMVYMAGRRIHDPRAWFGQSLMATQTADYSFVSGTYNMKLDENDRDWSAYVEKNLLDLWSKSRKGLAFNMLCKKTKNRKENDLFYADWRAFRDFCESEMSPHVTVMRDYGLAEWTIYINR